MADVQDQMKAAQVEVQKVAAEAEPVRRSVVAWIKAHPQTMLICAALAVLVALFVF